MSYIEILYVLVVVIVVFLSIKASYYIDMLEKTTKLSGAFLGGVLLSAITSLPELFTSLTAVVYVDKPGLCISNILGSDIFNSMILAVLAIIFIRKFKNASITEGNLKVSFFVTIVFFLISVNCFYPFSRYTIPIVGVNILTILIIIVYAMGVKYLASDPQTVKKDEVQASLTVRQITVRFILVSVGIVISSIGMTLIADELSVKYSMGEGLAGAIFLGVATSLPEVTSTAALFKLKNFNAAVGNIVGSNLFNFLVLCIADFICLYSETYDYTDQNVREIVQYGLLSCMFLFSLLYVKRTFVKILSAVGVIVSYVLFLF
ncbi:MAG: hypothetical protein KBS95_02795 [Alistipes sp.]|nr:hypothetical protein [Candidatus Alistipes equi]